MRLATVSTATGPVVAVQHDGKFYAWADVVDAPPVKSVLEALPMLMANDRRLSTTLDGAEALQVKDGDLLAPIPVPPRDLICLGENFAAHAAEFSAGMGEEAGALTAPIVFTKATTAVCGPNATVYVDPEITQEVDYEVELAVIIGEGGKSIARGDAFSHIAGYTVLNDLTARDLQRRHKQWFLGKSPDGFAPMGPVLVTADGLTDPANLTLSCWVDGERRQHAPAGQMIFDIPFVIETISKVLTLQTGDIIAMGTPEGVGIGLKPPRYLHHGAVVVSEIAGIGRLRNTIEFVES
ncbi:MAG: fumarylacetoacetate hydrolase family protein [Actinobacteria bacterium]|nr:fumarylacetoacetate hydrolase family protein [Actinomycetota bacterium]